MPNGVVRITKITITCMTRLSPCCRITRIEHRIAPPDSALCPSGLKFAAPDGKLPEFRITCRSDCGTVAQPEENYVTDIARIVLDPAVPAGKPLISGTRLSVDFTIGLMADGWTEADISHSYPGIPYDDVAACLAYARDLLRSEKVYPSVARNSSSRR